jgi:signal transduction histidine kinase
MSFDSCFAVADGVARHRRLRPGPVVAGAAGHGAIGMPETIRGRRGGHARRRHAGFVSALGGAAILFPGTACAAERLSSQVIQDYFDAFAALERHEIAALALTLGVIMFAVVTAIALVRARRRGAEALATKQSEINALREERDSLDEILFSEPQVVVVWGAGSDDPRILGEPSAVTNTPMPRRILAFGTWLAADHARTLEGAVDALRARGEAFAFAFATLAGHHVEIHGRPIAGQAVLRIKELTGAKGELATLATEHEKLKQDIDTVGSLLAALPSPIWARDTAGRLSWVNTAYARAVDARDEADAVARNLELLDAAAREGTVRARASGEPYAARLPVIVAGNRRILDIVDRPSPGGSAGMGIDVTEVEAMRSELTRMTEAHRRILDQLSTAVAIFTAGQRLSFYNTAYRVLWDLDAAFLDTAPTDSAVLDRLRAARKLPEQADFRKWKTELHDAYRATEPRETEWYLPGGRTLRVVATANPEGGVTYLFDDVTERLKLERERDALIRVQGETLEALAEGVAVFGSDGRLNLYNRAFVEQWKLSHAALTPAETRPHIETVIEWCRTLFADDRFWSVLRGAVTGLESREPVTGRLERTDGSVIDSATAPLPDGATLITFQDVTDSVNVERALTERADALQEADQIKSTFVQHVSYELRSPLTNIIGFAQLLDEPSTGPLTGKQREYLSYIGSSSGALLAIINDILDLATIDAGAMTLDLKPVDIRAAVDAAAEGLRDRLAEKDVRLALRAPADVGSFVADERRVRQILFNLLSNAVSFSPASETVTLSVARRDDHIVFAVTDHGPGIPAEIGDRVFEPFETHALGQGHRGAGLGLSIVRSFVALHGGTVTLDSAVGRGTTVTCTFPLKDVRQEAAA